MVREFNKNRILREKIKFKNSLNFIGKYSSYKECIIELIENKINIYNNAKFEG